jgi:hypothetical protein
MKSIEIDWRGRGTFEMAFLRKGETLAFLVRENGMYAIWFPRMPMRYDLDEEAFMVGVSKLLAEGFVPYPVPPEKLN